MPNVPAKVVTNPILLWLFRHGWEDPTWGSTPVGRIAIASAIHELAGALGGSMGKEIQAIAGKSIAESAKPLAK